MYSIVAIPIRLVIRRTRRIESRSGRSGAEIARRILTSNEIHHIKVEELEGEQALYGYYRGWDHKVALSKTVYPRL